MWIGCVDVGASLLRLKSHGEVHRISHNTSSSRGFERELGTKRSRLPPKRLWTFFNNRLLLHDAGSFASQSHLGRGL